MKKIFLVLAGGALLNMTPAYSGNCDDMTITIHNETGAPVDIDKYTIGAGWQTLTQTLPSGGQANFTVLNTGYDNAWGGFKIIDSSSKKVLHEGRAIKNYCGDHKGGGGHIMLQGGSMETYPGTFEYNWVSLEKGYDVKPQGIETYCGAYSDQDYKCKVLGKPGEYSVTLRKAQAFQ